ncbi:hypothetical protein DL98DRAFT_601259 [Cadophora sp. DSE1049]|nr:hypothetical protein DL98DRAFT_601259 [Cadophora sp. DSE1049]
MSSSTGQDSDTTYHQTSTLVDSSENRTEQTLTNLESSREGATLSPADHTESTSTFEPVEVSAASEAHQPAHATDDITASAQLNRVEKTFKGSNEDGSTHVEVSQSVLGNELRCVICLKEYSKRATVLPYGHEFDYICIQMWIANRGPAATKCPYCRGDIAHLRRIVDSQSTLQNDVEGQKQVALEPVFSGPPQVCIEYPQSDLRIYLDTDEGFVKITRSIRLRVAQQSLDRTKTTIHKTLLFETRKEASGDWEGLNFKALNKTSAQTLEQAKMVVNDFMAKLANINYSDFTDGLNFESTRITRYRMGDGTSAHIETVEEIRGSVSFDNTPEYVSGWRMAASVYHDTTLYEIGFMRDGVIRVVPQTENDNRVRNIVMEFGGILEWFDRSYPNQPGREQLDRAFTYLLDPYEGVEQCVYCQAVHRRGKCLLPQD